MRSGDSKEEMQKQAGTIDSEACSEADVSL